MFSFEFLIQILPQLLRGLLVTVEATFGGFALALIIGLILALGRRSKSMPLRLSCGGYIAFMRCTPLLVQLYFAFYVLPSFGIRFSALATGILCLGLHIGAYIAEVYRAGIEGVARGQWEAALAIGLKPLPLWLKVILPQAVPPMIPPLGNYLIGLFKETPLLAAITVVDLFGAANNVAGLTYRYNEPYTAVTVILLSVSLMAAYFVRKLERRFSTRGMKLPRSLINDPLNIPSEQG
ncbi:ectoine/hydroxyectoine ABC transporter permease subunit EhuD [Mesorhizobium sp. L2C066B000]|uniref:ectoine/hydroxyectoine ABC transporter permease subunit EhuD n=1 Tax=Mesorhizobium sp. L2C066B000 TaxID=1287105 RepID=UPI0003CFBC69|nr:ectoine/hydroxyectoine ABC transporter permease subunit EhuD [Mesorhizobium sp. L2C066B000]ESZ31299.1 amino acid ABC transporter permease [Mesorhizobium sp. L2C066B000]